MNALDTALYARLAGDATLTGLLATPTSIFKDVAPAGSALPFVVFSQPMLGVVQYTMGRTKAFEAQTYLVKGVAQGDDQTIAGAIHDRIFVVLQDAPLVVSGFSLLVCQLAGRIAYTETTEGVLIRHAGGRYLIEVA